MNLTVDLHSHSGYSGGVGRIELSDVAISMKQKGIDIFGTGDCAHPARIKELIGSLQEKHQGLYSLPADESLFLLQTEIILSTTLPGHRNRIVAHHVILFPDFNSIRKLQVLFRKWQVKNTIGRPFLLSRNRQEMIEQLFEIRSVHDDLELFPAHIMTPDGIYGGKNNLSCLEEFYGPFLSEISVIETGLSADPRMLSGIPDLCDLTFISNSDCHSSALNRIGREFTVLDVSDISYREIIRSLRQNKVVMTAEFNPAEGRYFLTGHRAGRTGHTDHLYFPGEQPPDLVCPVCGRIMQKGVRSRCAELSRESTVRRKRVFLHLIPLIEVIACGLGIKSLHSARVREEYERLIGLFGSEIGLWRSEDTETKLEKSIDPKISSKILAVKQGRFGFEPPGFDGLYGQLTIGDANGH